MMSKRRVWRRCRTWVVAVLCPVAAGVAVKVEERARAASQDGDEESNQVETDSIEN